MLEIISLSIDNLRVFDKKQVVEFGGRDKLIQVDGENQNTGGSSGAGKSSVFLALDYLLGINDVPATVLQSWLTKEPINVMGVFLNKSKPLTITRNKKTGLVVEYDGETISDNKQAEEKLSEIIGIPRKVFKKMVHKKQGDTGFFLGMTGKETYEFLADILDLQPYIQKSKKIEGNIKTLNDQLNEVKVELTNSVSAREPLVNLLRNKVEPQTTILPPEEEKKQLKLAELELTTTQKLKEDALAKITKPVPTQVCFDKTRLVELTQQHDEISTNIQRVDKEISEFRSKISEVDVALVKAKNIAIQINKLKEERKSLEQNICHTCLQTWIGESAEAKIKTIDEEIKQHLADVLGYKQKIDSKPIVEQKIAELQSQIDPLKTQLKEVSDLKTEEVVKEKNHQSQLDTQYSQAMNEFYKNTKDVEDFYANRLLNQNDNINKLRQTIQRVEDMLRSHQNAVNLYEVEVAQLNTSIDQYDKKIQENEVKQFELEKSILIATEANRLIKTYVLRTFQETLDAIGETATTILSGIPNVANSTIYFESCKENKNGSLKDEVSAIINKEGVNKVPVKALCGGEGTAANLAVDLAVIDVIETKTAKGANFFIMDEPFNGLDAVCREQCLQILKQFDTSKKIILVDHSSELKEMVSDVITVVKTGESSEIR